MKQIYANNFTTLSLGRQGENLARQVVFDIQDLESLYGSGTVEVIYQRPGDELPYPLAVRMDGTIVTWDVTATDTEMSDGYGKCELRYYVGETLAKSKTWMTWVDHALQTPSETAPPEPEQGWVDQVVAVGAAAKASADAAKADADRAAALAAEVSKKAAQTAKDAVQSAQAMEAAQMAQRLAEEAQSAAEAARTAAAAAQAAAEQSATDAAGAKQGAETAQKAAQDAAAAAANTLESIQTLYQEMQTWAQGVIQDVNAAGSAAVQSVQSAGDAQIQRVAEEGTRQTSNAKAQADAAALSASGAAQSAQQAAESAAVYDDVVADVNQLKQDLTDLDSEFGEVAKGFRCIKSPNLFDKSIAVLGKYASHTGEYVNNASFASLFFPVVGGETYTVPYYPYRIVGFTNTERTSYVDIKYNSSTNITTFTVPSNVLSINLNLYLKDIDTFMIVRGNKYPDAYYPYGTTPARSIKDYIDESNEEGLLITVGSGRNYNGFIDAIKALKNDARRKTIKVYPGVYDIFAEMGGKSFLETITSSSWADWAPIIPPNTRVIGIGEVVFEYLPDADDIPSDNAVTAISPINTIGSIYIENITIVARNCRYCIHDESNGMYSKAVKKYKGVVCKKLANTYVPTSNVISGQAYACGFDDSFVFDFEDCTFESNYIIPFSMHNRPVNGDMMGSVISIKDCRFVGATGNPNSRGIRLGGVWSQYVPHTTVSIRNCYLNNPLTITREGSGNGAKNPFDVTLTNCTNVEPIDDYAHNGWVNDYPIKIYNPVG